MSLMEVWDVKRGTTMSKMHGGIGCKRGATMSQMHQGWDVTIGESMS